MAKRGARLNVQGMARREPLLQRCVVPPPGYVVASCDLAAGEPTVVAHYSKDPLYRYACFDGVGKTPYYNGNGVLMLSDIYLMTMSVSPIGAQPMRDLFDNGRFDGKTFAEQWLIDADTAKKPVKKDRDIHKMLKLAIDYGIGPKKMVKQCYERGYDLPLNTARQFHQRTWETFDGVRRFRDYCALKIKKDGYLVNAFGYRIVCSEFKSFNAFIQSSVSGLMHVLIMKLFAIAPWAKLVTVIHDELVVDVPEHRKEDFQKALREASESLNEDLKWSCDVRVGCAFGRDWYEAK